MFFPMVLFIALHRIALKSMDKSIKREPLMWRLFVMLLLPKHVSWIQSYALQMALAPDVKVFAHVARNRQSKTVPYSHFWASALRSWNLNVMNLKERMLIRGGHTDERMLIAMPSCISFLAIKIHPLLLTEAHDTRNSGHGHALECGLVWRLWLRLC